MLNVDENWAKADPAHGPARPEDGTWVMLSDAQVLRVLLHDLPDTWLHWCVELPDEADPDPGAGLTADPSRPPLPKFIGEGKYRVPVPPWANRWYPKGVIEDDWSIEMEEWEPEPDEDEDETTGDGSNMPDDESETAAAVAEAERIIRAARG
jgi:hypothetical protein